MTSADAVRADILSEATDRASARAQRALDAIAASGAHVELELSVFADEDDPWLPSV